MKKTIIVNVFAGPGAGKSTTAAYLFYKLKSNDVDCEMAREYAKDLVWEERHFNLSQGHHVTSEQIHRIKQLIGKVDVVITDSPILQALPYMSNVNPAFEQYMYHEHCAMDTINLFIKREKEYNPNGRNQTLDEAIVIDDQIKAILEENTGPEFDYEIVRSNESELNEIVDHILGILNER